MHVRACLIDSETNEEEFESPQSRSATVSVPFAGAGAGWVPDEDLPERPLEKKLTALRKEEYTRGRSLTNLFKTSKKEKKRRDRAKDSPSPPNRSPEPRPSSPRAISPPSPRAISPHSASPESTSPERKPAPVKSPERGRFDTVVRRSKASAPVSVNKPTDFVVSLLRCAFA